jgi:hypothetical protein
MALPQVVFISGKRTSNPQEIRAELVLISRFSVAEADGLSALEDRPGGGRSR